MSEFADLQTRLEVIIRPMAAKMETEPEYWVQGSDESISYCYDCAEKEVQRLQTEQWWVMYGVARSGVDPEMLPYPWRGIYYEEYLVDGGWTSEGDSQAFCNECDAMLDNSFTQDACKSELDHFEENGFDPESADDCYSLNEILCSEPFEDGKLSDRIQALARRIIDGTSKEGWQAVIA